MTDKTRPTLKEMGLPEHGPILIHNPPRRVIKATDLVEWCAKELEWMGRGRVAHEHHLLNEAAKRLREEAAKIVKRAGGERA